MVFVARSLANRRIVYYCAQSAEVNVFINMLCSSTIVVRIKRSCYESERNTIFILNCNESIFPELISEISTLGHLAFNSDFFCFEHHTLMDHRIYKNYTSLRKNHKVKLQEGTNVDLKLWEAFKTNGRNGHVEITMTPEGSKLNINFGQFPKPAIPTIVTVNPIARYPIENNNQKKNDLFNMKNSVCQKLPTSSSSLEEQNIESYISTCSVCSRERVENDEITFKILSCGHVLCDSCIRPKSFIIDHDICAICNTLELSFTHPNAENIEKEEQEVKAIPFCAKHVYIEAKYYCADCMQFLCSSEDCKLHKIIKLETATKSLLPKRDVESAKLLVEEINDIEKSSRSAILQLTQKSLEIKEAFKNIIVAAKKRQIEIEKALLMERNKIEKRTNEALKQAEEARRKIKVGLYVDGIVQKQKSNLNNDPSSPDRLMVCNIFRDGMKNAENAKISLNYFQNYQIVVDNGRHENIVRCLNLLFNKYTSRGSININEANPHFLRRYSNTKKNDSPELYNGLVSATPTQNSQTAASSNSQKIYGCEDNALWRKRKMETPLSLSPNSEDSSEFMKLFMETTSQQKPFTLLSSESKQEVIEEVQKFCAKNKILLKNTPKNKISVILEKQRYAINRLVIEIYRKQSHQVKQTPYIQPNIFTDHEIKQETKEDDFPVLMRQDIKQEISIEPPEVLSKKIKEEEPM